MQCYLLLSNKLEWENAGWWGGGGRERGYNMIVFFSSQLVTAMIDHLLTVIVTKIVLSGLILVRGTEEDHSQREEGGPVPLL